MLGSILTGCASLYFPCTRRTPALSTILTFHSPRQSGADGSLYFECIREFNGFTGTFATRFQYVRMKIQFHGVCTWSVGFHPRALLILNSGDSFKSNCLTIRENSLRLRGACQWNTICMLRLVRTLSGDRDFVKKRDTIIRQ